MQIGAAHRQGRPFGYTILPIFNVERRCADDLRDRQKKGTWHLGKEDGMKTEKLAWSAALVLVAAGIAGCGRHSKKEVYYLIVMNSSLPYWQTVEAGFNKAAAEYQVTATVDGPDHYDPNEELADFQKAVAAKPSGILVSVSDATLLQGPITSAVNAGVPVITVDSDAVGSRRLFFIGTNNLEAGRLGGRRMVGRLGGKGNVVVYTLAGQPNIEERLKGFEDIFANYPGIKVTDVVDIKSNELTAFDKTQGYMALTGDKKVNGFVCLDSACGKVVADAISRSGATDRVLVAWDVNPDTLNEIKSGVIDATIAQKPYTMGYVGLRELDQVFHDPPKPLNQDWSADSFAPLPVFVDTGTAIVDKSNVDTYLVAAAKMDQ
jgi:ribose transport system substrate-binding protein